MSDLINVVIPPLRQTLTYGVPSELASRIEIGHRVSVPLGSRSATGFVISKQVLDSNAETKFEIRPIGNKISCDPCFLPSQLTFFEWVADYYGDSLSNVIDVAIPPEAPQRFERFIIRTKKENDGKRGKLQALVLELLDASSEPVNFAHITRRFKGASPALKALAEQGYIEIASEEIVDQHLDKNPVPDWTKNSVDLNENQTDALAKIRTEIDSSSFHTFLLHGATGSGKTEVYIEAIRHAISAGKGALVIVPEIALTPQLVDRFRARLDNNIAILHSALSRRVRWDSWRALLQGRSFVAIGARSAIFAPVPNLGLIIVDEEHDSSYKQSEGLRYNARDLAIVRGKLHSCPVVLGTATPSLESYVNCARKKHTYVSLPLRHGSAGPLEIELVDLNTTKPWEMPSKNVSPKLLDALKTVLWRDEQAFILYNRRGFASYLQCEKCETSLVCPNCSVTFTYHQSKNALLCHYCNLSITPPKYCQICKPSDGTPASLVLRGAGTEKVFDELKELLPDASMERLDRDSATDIEEYRDILGRVRSGKTDILVGTQMIAKGHDLPNVTLVGIVDCDVGLHMPDFRAGERVFQLLTQSAGRAGRGDKQGKVILQTRVPKHPAIRYTIAKDFKSFAREEAENRKALAYPPYSRLLRIVASAQDGNLPRDALLTLAASIQKFGETIDPELKVLGPAPAPLGKLKAEYRWHLLVKGRSASNLVKLIHLLRPRISKTKKLKVIFDLDPQDML